jgi:outer membrane receptor protein involved in Fe transport
MKNTTIRASVRRLLLLFTMNSLLLLTAFGQGQTGQITGVVTDSSGASVPGAKVVVINEGTAISKSTATSAYGNYTVTPLMPATYTVVVSKEGFKSSSMTGVKIDVAEIARIDVALEVGQISEQVSVSGAGALLQTETVSLGAVVAESGVNNLPLSGRNFLQLATLAPGVTAAGVLGANVSGVPVSSVQVNGMRQSATSYSIDGADVSNQHFMGTAFTPAPDAIQEFKVETNNMSAKYGAGAVVNTVLKSGTNAFHGGVYEFFRNDLMDARNFFALTKPELRQNQFGGTLGGPVIRDKTFFFVDYQGTRVRQGRTTNANVPTAAQRVGNFAGGPQLKDPFTGVALSGNQAPAGSISPQAAFFLPFIPLPNTAANTFIRSAASSNETDQFDIRVDQQLGPADSLSVSYSFIQQGFLIPGAFPENGAVSGSDRPQFAVAGWTHTFGPSIVSHARLSYSHVFGTNTQQGLGTNYTGQAGIGGFEETSQEYPAFPQLTISGFTGIDGSPLLPFRHKIRYWNIGDTVTWVKGKHTLEFGADARWYEATHINAQQGRGNFTFNGTYTGNAFADFLYGVPFNGSRSYPLNLFGTFESNQDAFVQDTWKVLRRLTFTGGLRYDLIHPSIPLHNVFASVDPVLNRIVVASDDQGRITTTAQQVTRIILPLFQPLIVPTSQVGLGPALVHGNPHNIAPRIGLAYDAGYGFVLRGGYGIFYPLKNGNVAGAGAILNPPFFAGEARNNTTPLATRTVANLFPPSSPGNLTLAPLTFTQYDPNPPYPYIQQWNFSLQKVLRRAISLQASYVASKGTHLQFGLPVNIPAPGPGAIQARRPNPFFASGNLLNDTGTSSYNALQAVAEVRSWHGLYLLSSFTWGKSLDNQSSDGNSGAQDPANVRAEWAVSSFQVARRWTLASTYELPFFRGRRGLVSNLLGAWSVSNIVTAQSGLPFTPAISTNPANTGSAQRPNRIASGKLANPGIARWFDVAAFQVPAAFTFGSSARNVLTGPGFVNWDFSLFKDFNLTASSDRVRLQFRGEFYNTSNTPAFGQPVLNIQAPNAGAILTSGAARTTQLVLKAIF